MPKTLFGTDGVRGVANINPMTPEIALELGRAIVYLAPMEGRSRKRVVVGKDTRVSGYMIEAALTAGICSMGADVLLAGVLPTPATAFLTRDMRCNAGAVISASHNPYEDNGIKFFNSEGYKLSDELEKGIGTLVFSEELARIRPRNENIGRVIRMNDSLGRYIVFLKNSVQGKLSLNGFKIVLDCANGAAYKAAPALFEELGAEVVPIAVNPDGFNINKDCGSLHVDGLCRETLARCAHIGIALDGDADRVILSDEKGNQVNGDQIMGMVGYYLAQKSRLAGNTLVATVMSNLGLETAMADRGINLMRTPVGDKHVVKAMLENGYNFGGEQSGHLIFLDHNTSGDGIMSALQVIKIMNETQLSLSELTSIVPMFPQSLKNVEITCKRDLREVPEIVKVMKNSEQRLGSRGRLLVRFSGTQNLCRVMAEGENSELVEQVVDTVADAIAKNL